MPKRTTLTFTSENAPKVETSKLYVYYCKYSGKHAFTVGEYNVTPHFEISAQ